jgi:phosphoribosylglycinamide formyltransferase 1
MKLAVFVSGVGSILEAMIASGLDISLVVADRPCRGLDIAKAAGIPAELVLRSSYKADFDREAYTDQVVALLKLHDIELIALSGFLTIFSKSIFDHYEGKILNTHPSLLPSFKGAGPVVLRDTLAYGVKLTGCTIHQVVLGLDAGPIVAQAAVPVEEGDTPETLHERIKQVERRLYPETIRQIMQKASAA